MKNNESDEKLLAARVGDAARRAKKTGEPCFLPFLSGAEQRIAAQAAAPFGDDGRLLFYGGYDDADYRCAGFFPEYLFYDEAYDPSAAFPLCAVRIKGSGFRSLSHRDFLGAVMALGVNRSTVGDISVAEDGFSAYLFCLPATANLLCADLTMCANDRVTCTALAPSDVKIPPRRFEPIFATVSTPRMDAVICAALNLSREEAGKLILSGAVSLDHLVCTEKSKLCAEGTTISVRGYGRYLLYRFGDRNRRDRLRLELHRFV